jgi:hypothetical protein
VFWDRAAAASDEKCDGPEEQELPEDGNSKADEPEQAEDGKICYWLDYFLSSKACEQ